MFYTDRPEELTPGQLQGFFVGWPDPPSPETHLRILQGSQIAIAAIDPDAEGRVVGFITGLTDGVLSAYIPLLEVLPEYQGRGIGRELLNRMISALGSLYMVDLLCDPPLASFYQATGMQSVHAMALRRYDRQRGE